MGFDPFEKQARQAGYLCVAGVDEAGRGPLAGPVVAAAVVLPDDHAIAGLQDSKCLTARQRDRVYAAILQCARAYGIGMVSHAEIDQCNILQATREAMRRALARLQQRPDLMLPDLILIDGNQGIDSGISERTIVRGDARCASVAAASVIAKVSRDRLMIAYAKLFPVYGFEQHKGYPTRAHYDRLRTFGPCAIHRLSFRGVAVHGERYA